MSENPKTQTSMIGLLGMTGAVLSTGAFGWSLFRMYKSGHLDTKEIMTHVASFASTMGVCLSTSMLFLESRNSDDQKPIPMQKPICRKVPNLALPNFELSKLETFVDKMDEWDKAAADAANKGNILETKTSPSKLQEMVDTTSKYEDLAKRLSHIDILCQGKERKLPTDDLEETWFEAIENSRLEFNEKIISLLNELKLYIKSATDPVPLNRNNLFRSIEMSDGKRKEFSTSIREYANKMLLKIEQVIDEFVYSVWKAGAVSKKGEHKGKNALVTLEAAKKACRTILENEINQFSSALGKAAKGTSQIPSGQNCPNYKSKFRACTRPIERGPVYNSVQDQITWTKTSERESLSPIMAKLETPTDASVQFEFQEVGPHIDNATGKIKSPLSKQPSKLTLNPKQMNSLKNLESEFED